MSEYLSRQIKSNGNEKPFVIAGIRYIQCSIKLSSTIDEYSMMSHC